MSTSATVVFSRYPVLAPTERRQGEPCVRTPGQRLLQLLLPGIWRGTSHLTHAQPDPLGMCQRVRRPAHPIAGRAPVLTIPKAARGALFHGLVQ